jgi:hypothetical protein
LAFLDIKFDEDMPYETMQKYPETHFYSRYTSLSSLMNKEYDLNDTDDYQNFMMNRKESLVSMRISFNLGFDYAFSGQVSL